MLTDQPEAGELERHQSIGVRLSNFISQWIDRLQPSSELVLMVTALVVGIGAGLGIVVFRYLINGVGWIGYTWFPPNIPQLGKGICHYRAGHRRFAGRAPGVFLRPGGQGTWCAGGFSRDPFPSQGRNHLAAWRYQPATR